MALVRAVPLKDGTQSILSSGANGTAYDLSSLFTSGGTQKLYAGLHLTMACSTDAFQAFIQSASSSGFATATTEIIFNAMTSRGAQWGTSPGVVTISSTDRKYFRTRWTLATGSNAPGVKFLDWVSIR